MLVALSAAFGSTLAFSTTTSETLSFAVAGACPFAFTGSSAVVAFAVAIFINEILALHGWLSATTIFADV